MFKQVIKWQEVGAGYENLKILAQFYPLRPQQKESLTDDFFITNPAAIQFIWELNQGSAFQRRVFDPNVWAEKKTINRKPPRPGDYTRGAWGMDRIRALQQWAADARAFSRAPAYQRVDRILWRSLVSSLNIVNVLDDDGTWASIETINPESEPTIADYNFQATPSLVHSVTGINRKLQIVPLPQNPWHMPIFSSQPVCLSSKLLVDMT